MTRPMTRRCQVDRRTGMRFFHSAPQVQLTQRISRGIIGLKAAQLTAPRKWEFVEVEKPQPRDGYALLRLEYVGLCGSDRPPFEGVADSYPLPPGETGHEALGIVESCPSGRFQAGERVLIWGHDRGLFQEFVLAKDHLCVGMPAAGEPEIMLMSQLLGTVIHCMLKLDHVIGKRVVVLGQGAVGQLFTATLRNLGAQQIIAIDPHAYRLETARLMGATHTINLHTNVQQVVSQITDGALADVVIEAVGRQKSINQTIDLLPRGGTLVCFGVPNKDNEAGVIELRYGDLFRKEIKVVTSVGPSPYNDFVLAHQWIREGRIDVRPIATHTMPFEQIQRGFEIAYDTPEEHAAFKVVLKF